MLYADVSCPVILTLTLLAIGAMYTAEYNNGLALLNTAASLLTMASSFTTPILPGANENYSMTSQEIRVKTNRMLKHGRFSQGC
jgi:hypothetical protein